VCSSDLVELSREARPVSLARLAALDASVADAFAEAALGLLRMPGIDRAGVTAIGSHGQTVFHDPLGARSSLQLGDPSRIAVKTGIPVVADFRRADVALGGHGAPLLPVLHHALFARAEEARAVLNLGGIANLSLLPDAQPDRVRGFDTGPASCLMDEWIERHRGLGYDADGAWAASGRLDADLLDAWLADPWFATPPPKSTGRGQFHLAWVERRTPDLQARAAADVQRALCELTAASVAAALKSQAPGTARLLVCGGGVRNGFLMSRLRVRLPGLPVESTEAHGLDPQWVEATAFAWLACRRLRGEPGNLPSVTGASRPAVLGGIYAP
jgi:anhydro-N-acetylmuramic acid kinase